MFTSLNHDSSCGCVQCTPSTSVCYVGANLPNTGIQNNDTISVAVQKLDAAITAIPEANQFIKSNEPLSLAQRNGNVLYGILDQYTGEEMTLSKVTGTPVVDGVMYFQLINNYNVTEYFRRNIVKINPYIFGAKGDGINNDTSAIQSAINFCQTSGDILELEGNFLSDTITISESIKLETVCTLQTINNVDALVIQGGGYGQSVFIKHTGSLTIRGIQRDGFARGIVLKNGVLNSTFDKVYISNVGLGVDYEASGNNNIVAWNLLDIRSTSSSTLTTFTKGAFVSNTTLYNIGEITTPTPILTNMGTIIVAGNVYPIVAKPGATNTYYVGNFYSLPNGGQLYHYTGGGVLHRKHPDNGAIEYKTLRLWSIAGSSITVQSSYGVTVNGGEIEGCGTNVVVGGIYMNGSNPETIYSIRSLFEGLHTEGNTANKPFVYSLKNSMITFNGCLMGDGIQVAAPQTGVKFQSGYGTDRTSNYYYGKPNEDFPAIEPNDPTFKIYKDLTTGTTVYLNLRDLIPMMSYMGDLRVNYVCTGEYNMLNIPVGETRTLRVTPYGTNTLNGGTAYQDITITGLPNKTEYKITFLLVGNDFTYTVDSGENWIKSNESLSLAKRKGDVLYGILDQYTGEDITLSKVTGTPVVDGIIYFQLGTEYFKRNVDVINPCIFGVKADGVTDNTEALQNAIDFASTSNIKEIKFSPSENSYRFTHLDLIGSQYSGISLIGSKGVVFEQILGTRQIVGGYPIPSFARYERADGFLLINDGVNSPSNVTTFESTAVRDITIDGITFLNDVVNDEFDELTHQICAVGVSNFTVKNCEFIGFLGDGVAVTNVLVGSTNIRMNRNVNIIYNSFDGVNKDNRQAVSIYACDGFSVNYNKIKNTTRSDMPGAIDIEPDYISSILRGGEIKGNKIYNIGGNIGAIAITLANNNSTLNYPETSPLQSKITVSNNTIVDCTFASFTVISQLTYLQTNGKNIKSVVFRDNYISNSGFGYIVNVSDVIIENNYYENVIFSFEQINRASNIIIRENTIKNMTGVDGLKIETSSKFITIKDNKFINPQQHCITDTTRGGIVDLTGNWFDDSDTSNISYVLNGNFNLTHEEVGNNKCNNNRVTGNLVGTMLSNIDRMNNLAIITIGILPKGFPYGDSLNEYNDGSRNVILKTKRTEEDTVLQELITSDGYETVFVRHKINENTWSEFVKQNNKDVITGTLTTGIMPVAMGTNSIKNGILRDNGTNILLQTANTPFFQTFDGTGFLNMGIDTAVSSSAIYNTNTFHRFLINSSSTDALRINSNGNIGINTSVDNGVDKLQINGSAVTTQYKLSALNIAPASATSTGTLGEIRVTSGFIYVCVATDTWVRSALTTWT
jgi:hypothetical protein